MNSTFAIETSDLRKHYGAVEALRGVSLTVPVGSICGFLGRNGAGKTTTIKVLLGMARPTSGTAQVFGVPAGGTAAAVDVRRRIGFVSDDKDLFDYMTVAETIRFTAAFFPRWRADLEARYLRSFELPPDRKVKALSRGMRTKLSLLLALCRGADLLILDEPTSGLDPAMTEEVLQALVGHRQRGADGLLLPPDCKSIRSRTTSPSSIAAASSCRELSTMCASGTAMWSSSSKARRRR